VIELATNADLIRALAKFFLKRRTKAGKKRK